MKNQKYLSYYRSKLEELLNSSFPDLVRDHKFIEQRSKWAANAYEGAFLAGNPIEECNYIANQILFENLHFSKFDTVFQAVCNEFDHLMADEELRPFALKMYYICSSIFDSYILTDDFAYSVDYDLLYAELVGEIAIWIEEHGLQ